MPSRLVAEPGLRDHGRGTAPDTRGRAVAAATVLLTVLLGATVLWSLAPPAARPASAPAGTFSADRAVSLLGGIAAVPHPTGSPAAADVRDLLVARLRALGLQPTVQTRVAVRHQDGAPSTLGTVSNVRVRIAGTRPTGLVVLGAHYDSVPIGPGASDNGVNVAAVLEIARVLVAEGPPRNDVELLFTDAEEEALLGAQAFVESGVAGDPRRAVVVNLDARGVSGRSVMFQMSGTGLTPAVRAAEPVTTSLAAAVYRLLPNGTDLSVYDEAGMRGLNFALLGGEAHYHTPHDDLAHVSPRSVQSMGDAALGAVRQLSAADLTATGPQDTYFWLPGTVVVYPALVDTALTAGSLVAFVVLLRTGRRQGVRLRGVLRGAATFASLVPVAVLVGAASWWLLTLFRPGLGLAMDAVYQPDGFAVAQALVLLAAAAGWYRWARRRASADEIAVGVLAWFVAAAVVCAVLLPGGAYLFVWPALVGSAALAVAFRLAAQGSPMLAAARGAAALPATVLLLPVATLLVPALGLTSSAVPLVLLALIAATVSTSVEPVTRWTTLRAATAMLLVAAAGAAAVGTVRSGYDAAQPRAVSLGYLLEPDADRAGWISLGGPEQPVVGSRLTEEGAFLGDRLPPWGGVPLTVGPADVTSAPDGITADLLQRTEGTDGTTARFRVRVPSGVHAVEVYVGTETRAVADATVDGVRLEGGENVPEGDAPAHRWGFRYAGPPADGIDVTLRTTGTGPVRIRVVTIAAKLPDDVAVALPEGVSWSPWPMLSGETYVVRDFAG